MAFLTEKQIEKLGFKSLGKNVKISNRCVIYNPELIEIGDNSRVDDFCVLSGRIVIGKNVHITVYCNIAGGEPGVNIDSYSTVAYGCHIMSQSDDYTGETMTNSTIPKEYKSETFKAVFIGKHVIIGAGSIVLPGCNIEEGCSVGAMSLINKPTMPWGVYFGVPAKRIKDRNKNLLIKFTEYLENDSI
ncbi:acyltransferase [Shewanella sp. MF05960]|uniref:acyltransferase n=1 Tax=Shewanella sp. MF05960 TaxID=3434874 RepID=UPI003D795D3D